MTALRSESAIQVIDVETIPDLIHTSFDADSARNVTTQFARETADTTFEEAIGSVEYEVVSTIMDDDDDLADEILRVARERARPRLCRRSAALPDGKSAVRGHHTASHPELRQTRHHHDRGRHLGKVHNDRLGRNRFVAGAHVASMDVLITGVYGRCGTAIIDHLHDRAEYDFTYYNRSDRPDNHPYGGYETVVGDITNAEKLTEAASRQDTLIHFAAYPYTDGSWADVFEPNIVGMYNALEAARREEIESFVFGSTNHVMGLYEEEYAPELYSHDSDLVLHHTDPVRPDSYYGTSKSFGEDLGRYYVENFDYPKRFYVLRICTVKMPEYDHPYGDAEQGVENGEFKHGCEEYQQAVARMKAMWQSRRDFAHQVDCCLQDDDVEFDIFHGVSDNSRRWFDLEHARARIDYQPQDNGDEWDEPPA